MEKLLKYCLSMILVFSFISCEKINEFYKGQQSTETLVALANSKYESLNDTNLFKGYTEYESFIKYYEILEEVKTLNPNHEKVWVLLANAYANKGMAKEWKAHFDKALFLNTEKYLGWRGFHLLYKFRDYEKALADLEAFKLKNSKGVDYIYQTNINFFIALCHMQLGDYNEALRMFDLFIEQETEALTEPFINETAYLYKGIIFNKIRDYNSAIEAFDKGLKLNNNLSDFYFHKSIASYNLGNIQNAELDINLALEHFENGYNNSRHDGEEFEELFIEDILKWKRKILNKKNKH